MVPKTVQAVPYNITSHVAALAEGLSHDDRIHLKVRGNQATDNAFFCSFLNNHEGIMVVIKGANGRTHDWIYWSDVVELWPLEEKPNIYHSCVPEVAEVLKKLKADVQVCVEQNNMPGVLYLLDQVTEVRKAERLFREARHIISGIRF